MNIDDLTLKQIKEIQNMNTTASGSDVCFWEKGQKYLIRTVTMILTGELVGVSDKELLLKSAAWIADTGRYSDSLLDTDNIDEVEPYHKDILVGRGSIIDATQIDKLPMVQK